ncbi:MAG: prolipoprotein diacylglyceryl transferase [Synergistes sp.]|nr:prolipoprotein diacylglyceryl transferase [Synergistes sp.]
MYPVLFKLSFAEVRSYYLLWASALFLFVYWTRYRAEKNFGIESETARKILVWIYVAGVLGSSAAKGIENMPRYLSGEIGLYELFQGLSSWGGFLAGGIVGMWQLHKNNVNIQDFAEASALPSAAMIGIGRLGCFMEGCCQGLGKYCSTPEWYHVHLAADNEGFYRLPTQLTESLAAFAILIVTAFLEKCVLKNVKHGGIAVEFPLFMLLYGGYRLFCDGLREVYSPKAIYVWGLAVAIALAWLAWSLTRLYRMRDKRPYDEHKIHTQPS